MFSEARWPGEFALVPRTFVTVPSISRQSRSGLALAARRTVREVSSAAAPLYYSVGILAEQDPRILSTQPALSFFRRTSVVFPSVVTKHCVDRRTNEASSGYTLSLRTTARNFSVPTLKRKTTKKFYSFEFKSNTPLFCDAVDTRFNRKACTDLI